jgi:MHS family proline/betaine transporter-like MFS transporter
MLAGAIGLLTVKFLPESAQMPLKGSQPMVGSREERSELITVSRQLSTLAEHGDGARNR